MFMHSRERYLVVDVHIGENYYGGDCDSACMRRFSGQCVHNTVLLVSNEIFSL